LLRRRKGLAQDELGRQVNVTGAFLSCLENARKPPPTPDLASRIAAACGMEASEAEAFLGAAKDARIAWKEWMDERKGGPARCSEAWSEIHILAGSGTNGTSLYFPVDRQSDLVVELTGPCTQPLTIRVRHRTAPSTEERRREM